MLDHVQGEGGHRVNQLGIFAGADGVSGDLGRQHGADRPDALAQLPHRVRILTPSTLVRELDELIAPADDVLGRFPAG